MSDFLKMLSMVVGLAVTMYVMLQQHEYRLVRLEATLEQHLEKHEQQSEAIQKTLTQIQIQLGGFSESNQGGKSLPSTSTRTYR